MKKYSKSIIAGAATLLLVGGILPGFAQAALGVNAGVGVNTVGGAGISGSGSSTVSGVGKGGLKVGAGVNASLKVTLFVQAKDHANQEIARRVTSLNALATRVNAMTKLSASEKSTLSATIQGQVTLLNALQAKIDADANSTSSLRADIKSITLEYRIYLLVIPQVQIQVAADRVMTIADILATLAGKLQTRITAAQSAGKNVGGAVAALADMNAKIADANVQVQAAVNETIGLKPDNGDKTIMQANTAALKDARTKIRAANQDLITARKDAGVVVKALAGNPTTLPPVSGSSTVSGTTAVSH
jgi:hypothetical protein